MYRFRRLVCALPMVALTMLAPPAGAQRQPASDPADDVVVKGRSGALLRSYVDRIARPEPGRQLARWNAPLCVRYDGLAPRYATYIQTRIARAAADVRLNVSPSRCGGTVLIKLTDRADALAKALVRMRPPRIGNVSGDQLLSPRQKAALEMPRTVRWMTASETVGRDGTPIGEGLNRLYTSSLIRSAVREDVVSKIILIDSPRLAGVSLNQLADYLAFVTLAAPDIAADYADTDSIMALFAGGEGTAPAAMTDQDRAFLEALYTVPADRSASTQKRAIRGRLSSRVGRAD